MQIYIIIETNRKADMKGRFNGLRLSILPVRLFQHPAPAISYRVWLLPFFQLGRQKIEKASGQVRM